MLSVFDLLAAYSTSTTKDHRKSAKIGDSVTCCII
jgi:hypothetical protein